MHPCDLWAHQRRLAFLASLYERKGGLSDLEPSLPLPAVQGGWAACSRELYVWEREEGVSDLRTGIWEGSLSYL